MGQLTRDEIVDAAVELLDQGPQALTMRALAERVGVTAAALYYWFPAKAELLDAIADQVARQVVAIDEGAPADLPWQERVRSLSIALIESANRHPATFTWAFRNYVGRPPFVKLDEAMLEILRGAGFLDAEAVLAKSTLMRFVFGHLGFAVRSRGPKEPVVLDRAEYPNVVAVSAASDRITEQDMLRYGLDRVIAAIEADLSSDRPEAGRRRRRPLLANRLT